MNTNSLNKPDPMAEDSLDKIVLRALMTAPNNMQEIVINDKSLTVFEVQNYNHIVASIEAYTANKIIEAIDEYKFKNFPHTKKSIAHYLGVSRVTLDAWIREPEKITISTVKKLLELEEALNHRKDD